jgi:hypothetical protein
VRESNFAMFPSLKDNRRFRNHCSGVCSSASRTGCIIYGQVNPVTSSFKGLRTHQFTEIVDAVSQKCANAEIFRTFEPLFASEICLNVDTGQIEERMAIIWRVFSLQLTETPLDQDTKVEAHPTNLVIIRFDFVVSCTNTPVDPVNIFQKLPCLLEICPRAQDIGKEKFGMRKCHEH